MQVQMRWENKLVAVSTSPHSLPKEEQTRQVKCLKFQFKKIDIPGGIMDTIFKFNNVTNNK